MTRLLSDGRPGRNEPTAQRDRWGNAQDLCTCGEIKLARAAVCKACRPATHVGVPKTATPSEGASHYRARQLCPEAQCAYEGCDKDGSHVHHIDGDPFNNDLANLIRYCPRHHMVVDGRLEAARNRAARVGMLGGRKKRAA